MSLKEFFIKRLSESTSGMRQKEIAKIMGCSEGTISKYLNTKFKDFPTAEMLYNLAEYLGVSIDWLLGRSAPERNENLTPRDICKMLLKIFNTSHINFSIGHITVEEECYKEFEQDNFLGADHTIESTVYYSLYFSKWFKIENDTEQLEAERFGNYLPNSEHINLFLSRLHDIILMKKKGNLNQEMYDRLVKSYLEDVPDC